jgi:MFS family permease
MLPLAGQMIAKAHPGQDLIGLSACVIAAQLVMMVTASAVGRAMRAGVGRKKIFLVALVVLPIRGLLFAATDNAYAVIGIQILDGISAGIFGVVATIIASDLMRGTGRFSFAQGTIALAVGIGAALSNLTSGFIVDRFGFGAAFCLLAFMALIALVLFAAAMPETLANIRSSSASTIVHIPPAVAAANACEGHRR